LGLVQAPETKFPPFFFQFLGPLGTSVFIMVRPLSFSGATPASPPYLVLNPSLPSIVPSKGFFSRVSQNASLVVDPGVDPFPLFPFFIFSLDPWELYLDWTSVAGFCRL